jgi:exopolysaccharide production protein ExoZ
VIRPIQYLRAVAAMSIVWLHAVYGLPSAVERLGAPYFGASGVDLFFVISGFIMVVSAMWSDVGPGRFFCLRLIRIVPLYWLATFAMIGLAAWGHTPRSSYGAAEVATSLLFVPYAPPVPAGSAALPIVENGWTLNYEMFFYALFALWLAAPRPLRLTGLLLTLGALVGLGRLAGPFTVGAATAYTSGLLLEFAAGALLGQLWLRGGIRLGLLPALSLIALGCYCIAWTHPRLVILAGAALILAGSLHPRIGALENRLLLQLGNASYSLYLTHQFVIDAVVPWWPRLFRHPSWVSTVLYMACILLLCTIAAWLCHLFIERPLTSRLRKLVRGPAAAPGQPAGEPQPGQLVAEKNPSSSRNAGF